MVGVGKGDLGVKPLNPINDAEREKKDGAMPQVGHEDNVSSSFSVGTWAD